MESAQDSIQNPMGYIGVECGNLDGMVQIIRSKG